MSIPWLAATREFGPLRWAQAPAAWVTALLVVVVLLAVRTIYRRERARIPWPSRVLLVTLRTAALLLLLFATFQPYREEISKSEDKGHLVVLVDTSASMARGDKYPPEDERRLVEAIARHGGLVANDDTANPDRDPARASRFDQVRSVIADRGEAFLRALEERFVVHLFAFDQDLRTLATTDPLAAGPGAIGGAAEESPAGDAVARLARALRTAEKPSGGRTRIGEALKGIAAAFLGNENRRLAGVLLLSDGRDNSEVERPLVALASLGKGAEDLHVTAVALGDPRLARNLRVDSVLAKEVVLVHDEVVFQAELRHTGFAGVDGVEVRLEIEQTHDATGRPLAKPRPYAPPRDSKPVVSTRVKLLPEGRGTPASLRAQFVEAGTFRVHVRASLPGALAREDAIREDDEYLPVPEVRVVDQRIRVLLADFNLRHESWFLKNLLVRESRSEKDPRRFDAQVFVQSFDPEVEQPHGKTAPPLRAFPSTRNEIFAYDVIVIGDLDVRRLAPTAERSTEVLGHLRDFVAAGGGLAFVAGVDRNPKNYVTTPLEDLLPVVVQSKDTHHEERGGASRAFRIAPTEAGRSHPILTVVPGADPEAVDRIWRERDGWEWYWLYPATGGLKPGATALARVGGVLGPEFKDERQDALPVFVTMSYGKGRVFFSAIDDIWRIRKEHGDLYYGGFWDEAIRHLATYRLLGGNKRVKISTDKARYFRDEVARITVSALDRDYQPLRTSLKGLQVEDPFGRPVLKSADAAKPDDEGGPGIFRLDVPLPETGTYRITVDPDGDGKNRAEKRVDVVFASTEDQDTIPDHAMLREIVKATNRDEGRHLVPLWDLERAVMDIPSRTTERILAREEKSVWDRWWTLAIATALLGIEWAFRKKYQMI